MLRYAGIPLYFLGSYDGKGRGRQNSYRLLDRMSCGSIPCWDSGTISIFNFSGGIFHLAFVRIHTLWTEARKDVIITAHKLPQFL